MQGNGHNAMQPAEGGHYQQERAVPAAARSSRKNANPRRELNPGLKYCTAPSRECKTDRMLYDNSDGNVDR